MRIRVAALAFALASSVMGSSRAQTAPTVPEKPKLALSISGPGTVKSGSKVMIQVARTNISGQAILFRVEPIEYRYEVVVHDAHGDMAADTDHGREVRRDFGGIQYSGPAFPLPPRETMKDELVISDLYDLSRPGRYSVQVSCRGAKSNTITMAVVP